MSVRGLARGAPGPVAPSVQLYKAPEAMNFDGQVTVSMVFNRPDHLPFLKSFNQLITLQC